MGKVTRAAGALLLVAAVVVGTTVFKDYLGISPGTWVLFLGLLIYVHYSNTRLTEQLGLAELPRLFTQHDREPIDPDHAVSEGLEGHSWGITPEVHLFYEHFARFADVMNEWQRDTPWRLQEVARTEVGTIGDDGPVYGRRYEVFYGRRRTGRVSLSDGLDYSASNPDVIAVVELYNARSFHGSDLTAFLDGLAAHVAEDDRVAARQHIRNAMTEALWQLGPDVLVTNADLEVRLTGSAAWYLREAGVT